MLQRVQSIYLFFASVALFALYLFPVAYNIYVAGVPTSVKITGLFQNVKEAQVHTEVFVALTAVTAIVAIIPLVIIFLYRNRKQQIALCYSTILVIIGYSFWVAQTVKSVTQGVVLKTDNFGIGLFLPPIAILLMFLAIRNIRNDERLVRSADRLR